MKLSTRITNAVKAFSGKQPVQSQRSFAGAQMSRLTSDWLALNTSADSEARNDLWRLRNRCRELERDDPYVQRYLKLIDNNVLGSTGVKLQMKVRDLGGSLDRVANQKIEDAWINWCEKDNCTVTGHQTLHEASRVILRSVARDGAILVRKIKGFNNPFKFALQILEIDFLDIYYNVPATNGRNEIRMGVELDQWKRPVAYWLWTRHPGDYYTVSGFQRQRIPADEIVYVYRADRAQQTAGIPWIAPSMLRLKMLSGMEEAALVAYRAAACQGGWFKKSNPEGPQFSPDDNGGQVREVEPGLWTELPPGVEPVASTPQFPGASYAEYVKAALRGCASGLGVSYNSLANDLEGVNYSSIRAGVLEDREEFKQIQNWIIDSFFTPIFREWLPMAILSGQVSLPFAKLDKFMAPTWIARRWAWVDPLKDISAKVMAIENLMDSRTDSVGEQGEDLEELFETISEENKLMKQFGIKPAPKAGAAPQPQEDDTEEEEDATEPKPKEKK